LLQRPDLEPLMTTTARILTLSLAVGALAGCLPAFPTTDTRQGVVVPNGRAMDLALDGRGYFLLSGFRGALPGPFLTRQGTFTVDRAGYFAHEAGPRVQGYLSDATGVVGPALGDLLIGSASSRAEATSTISLRGHLDVNSPVLTTPFDFDVATYQPNNGICAQVTVFGADDSEPLVLVCFLHRGIGQWDFSAVTDGGGLVGGTAGRWTLLATGTLGFDSSGVLSSVSQQGAWFPRGGTAAQPLALDFGPAEAGLTESGANEGSLSLRSAHDGRHSGTLSSVQVNEAGELLGSFTNGASRVLGQVAVALVARADLLLAVCDHFFTVSPMSGEATPGHAGDGLRASVFPAALEQLPADTEAWCTL
jgi:flagellar hook protein FlgE